MTAAGSIVAAPASSANLGAGFDVLGMALDLLAEVGLGDAPDGAQAMDERHPGHIAFAELGGTGPIWLRTSIPMARGLGFSGTVRVAAAALAVATDDAGSPEDAIVGRADDILEVAARLEGHGDNVAASLYGGVTAYVDGRVVPIGVGPTLGAAVVVAWVPDVTTSTDRSRRALPTEVALADAVTNIGSSIRFVSAFAHDDPELLRGATVDALHQAHRLPSVAGAADALSAGVDAGAWCGWLSGSGPTVAFLARADTAASVVDALPAGGHVKQLSIDTIGARIVAPRDHPDADHSVSETD